MGNLPTKCCGTQQDVMEDSRPRDIHEPLPYPRNSRVQPVQQATTQNTSSHDDYANSEQDAMMFHQMQSPVIDEAEEAIEEYRKNSLATKMN